MPGEAFSRSREHASFRESIRLGESQPALFLDLAVAHQRKGDYAEALALINKVRGMGPNLVPDRWHSAAWVAQVERMAAMPDRYRALLKGQERPKDVSECLDLAQICSHTRRFADSVRFWAEALQTDPKLGEDRRVQQRYNAACVAALAAAGTVKEVRPPDDEAKSKFRGMARDWLELELIAWSKVLESNAPQARLMVLQTMQHWSLDPDLAAIRDPAALATLPEAERQQWQALWAEVEALRKRAEAKAP